MIIGRERTLRAELIAIGRRLYELRLVVARSGNVSCRLDDTTILITATGASLGSLTGDDIIKVDLSVPEECANARLTTEFPLHSLVYRNFPNKAIIHCHPTLTNAYFAVCPDIKALTFETKLTLGTVPVVEQDTPAVTRPEIVIEALKAHNLVVLKNHGVVATADSFSVALYLIETLEEAVKTAAVARLFKKDVLDRLDNELKETIGSDTAHLMFSPGHIQAIVDLVNTDAFIAKKGKELDLTCQLAIKMEGSAVVYKFNFDKGKIVRLDTDEDAPFVISAAPDVWEAVFRGTLEPFVATTQGKMKLKGELGKLSRWYVPFSRLFELFRLVPIK